ncbi:MAG: hypothetical protein V2G33_03675 [bacterium JZ-2024 1]
MRVIFFFFALFQWGTKPHEDRNLGIFFRHPPQWKVEEQAGGLKITLPSGSYLEVSTQDEIRPLQVEITDRTVERDTAELQKKGYEVSEIRTYRIDSQYVKSYRATKGQEYQRVWVTLLPETLKVYRIRYVAQNPGKTEEKMIQKFIQTWRFLGTMEVFWTTPFFTITGRNFDVFSLVLLTLFSLIFLGKGFWIDLYRLIRVPGDVFRDLSLAESLIYPIFLFLFSVFLLTAVVTSHKNHYLAQWDSKVREIAKMRSEGKVMELTPDPEMQTMLLADVHNRAMLIPTEIIESLPYVIPTFWALVWFVWGLGGFLGTKIFRGLATFAMIWKSLAGLFFPIALATIFFLWYTILGGWWWLLLVLVTGVYSLYLSWVCFAEVGRFRLSEGIFSWIISLIFVSIVIGGMGYYSMQNITPRFHSAFNPKAELIEIFAPPLGG